MKIRFLLLALCLAFSGFAQNTPPPNVILIITDDQGYGDLGFTGNPHIQTPVIDQLAKDGIRLRNFYVSPVCAPTRASLMTGRYSLRTGIRDTYNGGAIMASSEVTIAEMLQQVGYQTGAFGKWHLGDNYPSRPNDQGFNESVIHLSGGMGQVGDFTTWFEGDSSYFDPVLWHNGQQEAYQGYCSDIFTDQAIQFIENNQERPFFCYLAFNAPHTPLQVPDEYYQKYKDIDPASGFADDDRPFYEMSKKDKEDARKVYAMVDNIDDNLGRVMQKLEELELEENTLVIFMTDNGPQQTRYVAGLRGLKGSVYRGGVRVPFYLKLPSRFRGNRDISTPAAHIDILPTLAAICGAPLPKSRVIDGHNLVPVIEAQKVEWADRDLFFYWTRKYPERYHNIALQKGKYKLVGQTDYDAALSEFELFDLEADPYELKNLVEEQPAVAEDLKYRLDQKYTELIQSGNLKNPPLIAVGSSQENPVFLNRNDAGGERGIWSQEEVYGKWGVQVEEGHYNIRFRFLNPLKAGGRLFLELGPLVNQQTNTKTESNKLEMKNIYLPEFKGDLIPFYMVDRKRIFPFWVEVERIN